jgi:hypothetical protein
LHDQALPRPPPVLGFALDEAKSTRRGLYSGNRWEFCDFRELISRQFDTLGGPVAASLLITTALAAATTPLILALTAGG